MEFDFTTIAYDRNTFLRDVLPALTKGTAIYKIFDTRGQLIVLDRTSGLQQRLERFFGERSEPLRDLDLREITGRIEYRRTSSPFETTFVLYVERRRHYPKTYRKMRTFRLFTLMKLNRKQRFPRIYASRQIKSGVDYFGPFTTRGQFTRLKTALERVFKLRPCLYNIRGGDPHPDCMYFQMLSCSKPCNNDIDRSGYLSDVDNAIAFIQGRDATLREELHRGISELAEQEKYEEAETLRRKLDRIERARKELKETFPSVWNFHYLILLPSDTAAKTKAAFVRSGTIVLLAEYETATLPDVLPAQASQVFSVSNEPSFAENREWQYDEFCLVSNYLLRPLKSVELIEMSGGTDLAGYLKKRAKRKQSHSVNDAANDVASPDQSAEPR